MDGPQDNLTHQSGPTELVDSIHVLLSTHESMMQSQVLGVPTSRKGKEHYSASDNRAESISTHMTIHEGT